MAAGLIYRGARSRHRLLVGRAAVLWLMSWPPLAGTRAVPSGADHDPPRLNLARLYVAGDAIWLGFAS